MNVAVIFYHIGCTHLLNFKLVTQSYLFVFIKIWDIFKENNLKHDYVLMDKVFILKKTDKTVLPF